MSLMDLLAALKERPRNALNDTTKRTAFREERNALDDFVT
jgi:hypothetical protein